MISSNSIDRGPHLHDWLPVLLLPATVLALVSAHWPRWTLMWLLCFALYGGCKWLTWRCTPFERMPWWCHAAYLLCWPGMDAKAFLTSKCGQNTDKLTVREWLLALLKCLLGIGLFWGANFLVPNDEVLLGWLGMLGLALALHFGGFHLLSCGWRACGFEARPLMNRPLAAVRIGEFWGRRWNTAFRDLTHRFLFRPLTDKLGPRWGMIAGFVFSGLVHELVISVPAASGYGGPTLFFVIQAVGLLFERSWLGKAFGLGRGWRGWLFTMLVLVVPAYSLFHPPFIHQIVVPFMSALGAA